MNSNSNLALVENQPQPQTRHPLQIKQDITSTASAIHALPFPQTPIHVLETQLDEACRRAVASLPKSPEERQNRSLAAEIQYKLDEAKRIEVERGKLKLKLESLEFELHHAEIEEFRIEALQSIERAHSEHQAFMAIGRSLAIQWVRAQSAIHQARDLATKARIYDKPIPPFPQFIFTPGIGRDGADHPIGSSNYQFWPRELKHQGIES